LAASSRTPSSQRRQKIVAGNLDGVIKIYDVDAKKEVK